MTQSGDTNAWSIEMTLKAAQIQSRREVGGSDKRLKPRLPFLRTVRIRGEQSAGTYGLRSPVAFEQGRIVRIECSINGEASMLLRAVVRMCKPRPDGSFTLGVQFVADEENSTRAA
jgi:hypothetical protein